MSRQAPKSTLTPQMLRHFAVITIGVTACLGMFTNGEEAERIAKDIDAQQHAAATRVSAAVEKRVAPVSKVNAQFRDARRTYVPMAAEVADSGTYGQPMDTGGNGGGGGGGGGYSDDLMRQQLRPNQLAGRGVAIPLDQAAMGKPGELPTNRRNPGQQRRPSRKQLEQLEAASAARSGAPGAG